MTVTVERGIQYATSAWPNHKCGDSTELWLNVWRPAGTGPFPLAICLPGDGFKGVGQCDHTSGEDEIAAAFAARGFAAALATYRGYDDGLYGDESYPGTDWGGRADGSTQLHVKRALRFLWKSAGDWSIDTSLGVTAVGSSAGGHHAHMLSLTGVRMNNVEIPFASAVVWSGLSNAAVAGPGEHGLVDYLHGLGPTTDQFRFANPIERLAPDSPPQYVANSDQEFIRTASARSFVDRARSLGVEAWLRIPNVAKHASAYMNYRFTKLAPEVCDPAPAGTTVLEDSIAFALSHL